MGLRQRDDATPGKFGDAAAIIAELGENGGGIGAGPSGCVARERHRAVQLESRPRHDNGAAEVGREHLMQQTARRRLRLLPFILDSGASDVQIPADVAMTLTRAGTISNEDFIGLQTYTLADGSQLRGDQFKLRELRLGNHVVRDVIATTGPVKGDLLVGQSFLSRFGTWAIDNMRQVLILQSSDEDQHGVRAARQVVN